MWNTVLEAASEVENWQSFLEYKKNRQHLSEQEIREMQAFIDNRRYLEMCRAWERGMFPSDFPVKQIVNKEGTKKKRIVYSFPGGEGIFLKFIAFCLFRYDSVFAENCYAFRQNYGVGDAIRRIRKDTRIGEKYCLKVDISNYFNSIDVKRLLEKLLFVKEADERLYQLFERILLEEQVYENKTAVRETHGAMAGIPLSPFFANVYLGEVDCFFAREGVQYFRYSDDILLFADSMEQLLEGQEQLYQMIAAHGLTMNPEKVHISKPGEVWEFLGFCYRDGEIDLSDNTLRKCKAKMKRKADALRRWQRKKGLSGEKAAIGFIHSMNRKFYGSGKEEDFTWSRWFFPNLTADRGLKELDIYLQEYIRYTVTGRHYKGNYRIRYETLKEWGYRSLVNEYYKYRKELIKRQITE